MVNRIYKKLISIAYYLTKFIAPIRFFHDTRKTQSPISFTTWFNQKILGHNRDAYWPCSRYSKIQAPKNIIVGIDSSPGIMYGCYIQGFGGIRIGDYTQVAPNVGIISSNHDIYDTRISRKSPVNIGCYCWIGMGSIIMPGVVLGDFTIVGAGSVVTKSFPAGYCVIAGNPAKIIKSLDPDKCNRFENKYKYHGYIKKERFDVFLERLNK